MWILGHSFNYWARRGAAVKKLGSQLCFPEDRVNVHWFGVPGLGWPGMVPRLVWRYARYGDKMDKSRGKVNKLMASFVRKFGGIVVWDTNLDDKMPEYYREDRVHLTVLGMSFFTMALMEGIERALGHLDGGSCHA
ncbi:hypothetical protein XELAEV_18002084mg [Xenopus laevis]|nr:hypothetical protein XELAEV_18002084mg [Xenopus laevis]